MPKPRCAARRRISSYHPLRVIFWLGCLCVVLLEGFVVRERRMPAWLLAHALPAALMCAGCWRGALLRCLTCGPSKVASERVRELLQAAGAYTLLLYEAAPQTF